MLYIIGLIVLTVLTSLFLKGASMNDPYDL